MTTLLSPAEQAETTRFGMWDEETFKEIVEHHEDAPICYCPDCERSADYVLVTYCCKDKRLICRPCFEQADAGFEASLGADSVKCGACGHVFGSYVHLRDIVKVVPV